MRTHNLQLDREIDQWVMMYTPRHPFLKRALLLSAARVLDVEYLNRPIENIHNHVLETTGPRMYKDAIEHVLRLAPTTAHRFVHEDYQGNCTFKVMPVAPVHYCPSSFATPGILLPQVYCSARHSCGVEMFVLTK